MKVSPTLSLLFLLYTKKNVIHPPNIFFQFMTLKISVMVHLQTLISPSSNSPQQLPYTLMPIVTGGQN